MDSVFQELKRAREARRLSLNDVSDATLINISFLEAIERGDTTILPQTYVRAFIREYASFVGLDPADIMKRYDQINGAPVPVVAEQKPALVELAQTREEKKPEDPPPTSSAPLIPVIARFALPGIVVLTLGIVLWNLTRTKTTPTTKEIPFESAAQELLPDSGSKRNPPEQILTAATTDSLTLHATLTDSAWVEMVIDNGVPQQYLFRPSRKITWRAKERFRLTTGSAGAIDLTLNEKHLGTLGKRGAVVRNMEFTRQTLHQK